MITRRVAVVGFRALFLLAAILIFLALYVRLFAGRMQEQLLSPDGNRIAEYRIYDFSAATDAAQSAVQLRTKLNPFRHTVFGGANYGADLTLAWIDSTTLLIRCVKCSELQHDIMEQNWNGVAIQYEIH